MRHVRASIITLHVIFVCCGTALCGQAGLVDRILFGQSESEKAHQCVPGRSDIIVGESGQSARRLLAPEGEDWQGGKMAFALAVDPEKTTYVTIKLSGSEINPNRLVLYCEGRQIGYLHLGDTEILDFGTEEPACIGRFYYNTNPLPESLTKDKTELSFEVRSHGPIWRYGGSFEQYQKPMTDPSRWIYAMYTHTDGFFVPPAGEKQGKAPAQLPVRKEPGAEVLDQLKERVNREITNLLKSESKLNQMHLQFLAKTYHTKWTVGYQSEALVKKVLDGLDKIYAQYVQNPKLAEADPATWNADWFGLGPSGDVLRLLAKEITPKLDEMIDDGTGKKISRREGFLKMLVECRDWHQRHRRLYTNQSMINDLYGIYLANRGIRVVEPSKALPEEEARGYLYESVGLQPWLGSDTDSGPSKSAGEDYNQLTAKGLTKELGYVGGYGEVLDWVACIYESTRGNNGVGEGDARIKAQLAKIALARAPFRYPATDADGCRAMRMETIVGWRDMHYPGEVVYAQRPSWDGLALDAAASTLDERLVGYTQQMFEDNQFFKAVEDQLKNRGLRVTVGLLKVPEHYEFLQSQPASPHRLPMSSEKDYVFTDEENGVIAVRHGNTIVYASLFWRARNAVNFLGRVHLITPEMERNAVIREETEYEPSGMTYKRRDWIDFGFANGGHKYPGELRSAHTGEELPIAKIPDGVQFKAGDESVYASKGTFYKMRYGPYLIGINCTNDKVFSMEIPESAIDLVTGNKVPAGKQNIAAMSTMIAYFESER